MISRHLLYKGESVGKIKLDDEDAEILDKAWKANYQNRYKSKNTKYFRAIRCPGKKERELKGLNKGSDIKLHREVWEKHYGEIPKGLVIDHIDCDTLNNQKSNLRLLTRAENTRRSFALGRPQAARKASMAKNKLNTKSK